MTPNHKGAIGEIAVTKELMQQGFDVYAAVGHASKIDLVCIGSDAKPKRIQVKYSVTSKEVAVLYLRKNCLDPKYTYHYSRSDVDVFALYVADKDTVVFISSSELFAEKDQLKEASFRFAPPNNNQTKGCRMASDYLTFPTDA